MNKPRERGILFSGEMVRAILDGRKYQTRRVVKPQPPEFDAAKVYLDAYNGGPQWNFWDQAGRVCNAMPMWTCPYGKPGDLLYVRETWRVGAWNQDEGTVCVDYRAGDFARQEWLKVDDQEVFQELWIQSTHDARKAGLVPDVNGDYQWKPGQGPTRWRPSIHMPKKFARIWLELTDVRVERVQDVSVAECIAEGISHDGDDRHKVVFADLWDSLNLKRGYGWDVNPWCWVLSFKGPSSGQTGD